MNIQLYRTTTTPEPGAVVAGKGRYRLPNATGAALRLPLSSDPGWINLTLSHPEPFSAFRVTPTGPDVRQAKKKNNLYSLTFPNISMDQEITALTSDQPDEAQIFQPTVTPGGDVYVRALS